MELCYILSCIVLRCIRTTSLASRNDLPYYDKLRTKQLAFFANIIVGYYARKLIENLLEKVFLFWQKYSQICSLYRTN